MLGNRECELFAHFDTARQVSILTQTQTLDTTAADAVMGYMAGMHPQRYTALVDALARHAEGLR